MIFRNKMSFVKLIVIIGYMHKEMWTFETYYPWGDQIYLKIRHEISLQAFEYHCINRIITYWKNIWYEYNWWSNVSLLSWPYAHLYIVQKKPKNDLWNSFFHLVEWPWWHNIGLWMLLRNVSCLDFKSGGGSSVYSTIVF